MTYKKLKNPMLKLLPFILLPTIGFTENIVIKKDTSISNTWNIPAGTILRFESGGKISGKGTIIGGVIDANLTQQVFDTSLTVKPSGVYGKDFSAMWFGAKSSNPDNWWYLQKAINTCIESRIRNCYLPAGVFSYSKMLALQYTYKGVYAGVSLHFYGESEFWDERSVLNFTAPTGYALGIQVGKGTEVDHLTIKGTFTAPTTTGPTYYNTPFETYGSTPYLSGVVIDYDGTKNVSGSTGCKIHDMKVSGFTVCFDISPNGTTFNAEILSFKDIQVVECRVGLRTGQAQEKANEIHGIYSWGRCHTLIQIGQNGKFQAGNYNICLANVANLCIRLFDIRQSGWYSTNISNIYAEAIGSIGSITTGDSRNLPPISISNSTFHFALREYAGVQTLLTSNSTAINFSNCMFRYYGSNDTLNFNGKATFSNYFFSGAYKNPIQGSIFIVEQPVALKTNIQFPP